MKFNQILGDNQELRFKNIGYLKEKTKKWGFVFAAAPAAMTILSGTGRMASSDGIGIIWCILYVFIGMFLGVFFGYLGGKAYGWGWYWFKLKGGNFGESVSRSLDDALFYSFFVGSKSFLIALVILGVFVGIGGYIGLYCMIRYEWIEYRKLKQNMA